LLCTQGLIEGNPPTGSPATCDVRDVARAHILAAELPSASGRYIISERSTIPPRAVAALLQVVAKAALFSVSPAAPCVVIAKIIGLPSLADSATCSRMQKRFPKYRLPSVTSQAKAEEKIDSSKASC
jgi:nucleoside-diphosphate-sugar epimerase